MSEITHVTDPSLLVGNQSTDHLEKLHAAMADVLPMFELDDAEFDQAVTDYVATRAEELSGQSDHKPVGHFHGGTDKFISPESPMILSGMFSKPYYLDDNTAYETSFRSVRSYYRHFATKLDPDTAYVNAILQGSNRGQAHYFESITGNPVARMRVAADVISDDDDDSMFDRVSIADFKQTAMCQERAGVAHNTMLIFGMTSQFETGHIGVKEADGSVESEPHGFLTVLTAKGDRVIYDPTNPILVKDEDGAIVDIKASLYKMPDPTADVHEGTLRELTATADSGNVVTRSRQVIYTFA